MDHQFYISKYKVSVSVRIETNTLWNLGVIHSSHSVWICEDKLFWLFSFRDFPVYKSGRWNADASCLAYTSYRFTFWIFFLFQAKGVYMSLLSQRNALLILNKMVGSLIEDLAAPQTFRSCLSTWQNLHSPTVLF